MTSLFFQKLTKAREPFGSLARSRRYARIAQVTHFTNPRKDAELRVESVYLPNVLTIVPANQVKRTIEERLKTLLAKYTYPPVEVVIPILEKAGRGEEELANQVNEIDTSVLSGVMKILNLKEKNMRTVSKMFCVLLSSYGQKYEPVELSETRFCLSISDCPMLHVGKKVDMEIKSRFCDVLCSSTAKAMARLVLGEEGRCSWDKALIKGGRKCTVSFELVKAK